ncbi:TPA: hypothetical protein VIU92_001808 [Streptococcus pyogenes]|nr:hypothetical protein [Streptococcus pyogenes]
MNDIEFYIIKRDEKQILIIQNLVNDIFQISVYSDEILVAVVLLHSLQKKYINLPAILLSNLTIQLDEELNLIELENVYFS